ncbi:MAG: PEP-CTERM sorting domain-containing protein [Phycisphaerales bacterium]|jgi:hypothetical protein|nr:PEP-CTERM sorting domain-containing protein [Phycisphaerales bacterium]MBT7171039.1 PEP-CTERM sorting domain-containing protein [Phycisphaerales bacterium]
MIKQTLIGIVAIVSMATIASAAEINLLFSYDSDSDTTTLSYSGVMGVDHTTDGYSSQTRNSLGGYVSGGEVNVLENQPVGNISYVGLDSPTTGAPWATPGYLYPSENSGDALRFDGSMLMGPQDFTATTEISGWMKFSGKDLAELGFDASEIANGGLFTLDTANGDVDIAWAVETVPEPATMSLLALGGIGLLRRRKK